MEGKADNNIVKNDNIHKNHRQRLRAELRNCGFFPVNEHKNLEYLLFCCYAQKDTNPIAHRLIERFGSFSNVLEASIKDLMKVEGVGYNTAFFISSLLPIFEYYKKQKINCKLKISTTKNYVEHFGSKIVNENNEKVIAILLNNKYEIIKSVILQSGDDHEVGLDFNELFSLMTTNNCDKLVLMHNHPSGNPNPSCEDISNTEDLFAKLCLFNKSLVDHIIVASSGFYSFKEKGRMEEFENNLKNGIKFVTNSTKRG
ncbi:MAG: RadC family protein [Christensenellales bacterium]